MHIDRSQLVAALRGFIPALEGDVRRFVDQETKLLRQNEALIQGSTSKSVVVAPVEYHTQLSVVFQASQALQSQFLGQGLVVPCISARALVRELIDSFKDLSLKELVQLIKIMVYSEYRVAFFS